MTNLTSVFILDQYFCEIPKLPNISLRHGTIVGVDTTEWTNRTKPQIVAF